MLKIFKRMAKCVVALLVLLGLMSSNNTTNMYALAAHGDRRHKKITKVAKKKQPKRKPRIKRNALYRPNPKKNNVHHFKKWYQQEQAAKRWIVHVESRGRWNVRSYGSDCVGRYQLKPAYLGYVHGHINLNHKHQDQVAERYVSHRYGSWQKAKQFHIIHGWY